MRRRIDAPYEDAARALGYDGIEQMLVATVDLKGPELAALLGVSAKQAWKLRLRFGHRSPGRWSGGYVPTSPQHRPGMSAEELAAVPHGEQPERDGRLACLDCGRWFKDLAHHVPVMHDLTMETYRRAHGLDPYDARARELGFVGVAELLAATMHLDGGELAALLGISRNQARALRVRFGYHIPGDRSATPATSSADLARVPWEISPNAAASCCAWSAAGGFVGWVSTWPTSTGSVPRATARPMGCRQRAGWRHRRYEHAKPS